MADESTREKLLDVVARVFNTERDVVTLDLRINEDLDAESLQKFILVSEIEELTGTDPGYAGVNKCKTIGDLLDLADSLAAK